jgi:hypothetical protein
MPHDHPEILDDHRMIRRISDEFVVKENGKPLRLSSALLSPSTPTFDPYCGLSMDVEELMKKDGLDPKNAVGKKTFLGSITLKAKSFRSRDFFVGYDPRADNPYHGAAWEDAKRKSKLTVGKRRALMKEAEWLQQIDQIPISS